ncbi:hypothetical protein A9179_21935 [Pseudomonas alcaligenes]|uniref:Transmembrane protein n=1 Tax=Aquipseudomonas alcaligenes TaxID=43263 RepID=A0ABR7S7V6_AQUAC|nr:hypothetical protein [Pseudomonas alcaligenes]MBC9252930.1 hypothetical protein [Pseudomonas alcaligenes]
MSTTLNPLSPSSEAAAPRGRGRLQLILLLSLVIGPMILATAMYKMKFWVPESRSYHGVLIGNGQTLGDLGVLDAAQARWQLLVTAPQGCDEACRQLVYTARQIHIGLNRDASRASHGLAIAAPLAADLEAQLEREYPQLGRYRLDLTTYTNAAVAKDAGGAQLWIVDPHGNLVLRYDATVKGKAILNDLRLLLKLSQIG